MNAPLSLFGQLIHWVLSSIVDSLSKSPLEQDFGETSESDIQIPKFDFSTACPTEAIYPPLLQMFESIDGLDAEHVKKIAVRANELPPGRSADYRYQVRERSGAGTELQLGLTKLGSDLLAVEFHSSRELIEVIAAAFERGADPVCPAADPR
jgi:hypothetical protein